MWVLVTDRIFFVAIHQNNNRAPNPPLGYSRDCELSEAEQIRLVAEFHANRIRPSRIAYRLGIDIALIDTLLAGEYQASFFAQQLAAAQRRRRDLRMRSSERLRGQAAYETRAKAQRDYDASLSQP
jgi:hypothetical protein